MSASSSFIKRLHGQLGSDVFWNVLVLWSLIYIKILHFHVCLFVFKHNFFSINSYIEFWTHVQWLNFGLFPYWLPVIFSHFLQPFLSSPCRQKNAIQVFASTAFLQFIPQVVFQWEAQNYTTNSHQYLTAVWTGRKWNKGWLHRYMDDRLMFFRLSYSNIVKLKTKLTSWW